MAFVKNIQSGQSDAELLQHYKSTGSMQALGMLYQRYMDLLYGVCLKYLKNNDDAKDAVINIFEELITKVKKYEIDHFKAWLYQLAKNHCLMKIRSSKSQPVKTAIDVVYLTENMHLETVMDKEENLNSMEKCIEQLPDAQKLVIQLFYLQQKCYKEIAHSTAADINTVRSFIQNGRRNLKNCMEKQALQKA